MEPWGDVPVGVRSPRDEYLSCGDGSLGILRGEAHVSFDTVLIGDEGIGGFVVILCGDVPGDPLGDSLLCGDAPGEVLVLCGEALDKVGDCAGDSLLEAVDAAPHFSRDCRIRYSWRCKLSCTRRVNSS